MLNGDPSFRTVIANFEMATNGDDIHERLAILMQVLYESHAENVNRQTMVDPTWFLPFDPTPLYPDIEVVEVDLPDGDDYSQIDQDGNITM